MPPSSTTSSFIPKRSTGNKPRNVRRYNFFLLSIVSYALFVAAPLASAALFIYQIRAESQFKAAVSNLEQQITSFNVTDLARVTDFDERLKLSTQLVHSHVSLGALLAILENATADTVQFKDLSITRKDDKTLTVEAGLTTSALDGALFQRSTYNTATQIALANLSGVTLVTAAPTTPETKTVTPTDDVGAVTLKAEFTFAADKILYAPIGSSARVETIAPVATTPDTTITPVTSNPPTP